jgi:predicted acyltransferase
VESEQSAMNAAQTERTNNHSMKSAKPERLMSLDVLRGFDMFWIIGGEHIFRGLGKLTDRPIAGKLLGQLEHVRWEGLHFYDVIWPLFMFIMGAAMPFSLAKRRSQGATDRSMLFHAVKRALILFVLGMIAQGNLLAFDLSNFRPCYSVLHGIAAGYLIATIVILKVKPSRHLAVTVGFLLLYWAILMLVPVPGVGAGVLTPQGNVATYVDQLVLGRLHYGENTWFLSYLGFASSVLLGVLAGQVLISTRPAKEHILMLAGAGVACLALGLVWSLALPIIKLLWTSSYVLVAGGLSFVLLAIFYLIVDVLRYRRWAFGFMVIGMNSIVAYMAMMLFDFRQIGNIFVGSLLPRLGRWDLLVESTAAFGSAWLILYWLYRKKTFVKV